VSRTEVANQIKDSVVTLVKQSEFTEWLKEEKIGEGIILLNNSSFFRQKLKTSKSGLYLGIPVRSASNLGTSNLVAVKGITFNTDFKFVELKGLKKLQVDELHAAIENELEKLGSIVMVLVGEVENKVITAEPLAHSLFSEIEFNPASSTILTIDNKKIHV
jgi:hypothetical protein